MKMIPVLLMSEILCPPKVQSQLSPFNLDLMNAGKILCASVLFAASAALSPLSAQRVKEGAPAQRTQLLKVNLTDFAIGQYTAAFEHVLNDNSTLVVNLGGIGYTVDQSSVYLGAAYDELGVWSDLRGDLTVEASGFELTPEYRRFGYIHDGMPEGLYVSMFGQIRSLNISLDEDLPDEAAEAMFGLDYPHEIDHEYALFTFGAGFNLGYQWMADNGLSIDVYFGPMFRTANRSYDFGDNLPLGEDEAIDAVNDRMRNSYYPGLGLSDAYRARSGPWIRGGVTVGLGL